MTHYTINRDDPTGTYVVGHSLGSGWTRHIVELQDGDTADNPASTKRLVHGPGLVVYDVHATGITATEYTDARGFYADVCETAARRARAIASVT